MGKTVQSEESFRSSILEIRLELGIVVGVAVVEKNDEKVGPMQTWKSGNTADAQIHISAILYPRCSNWSTLLFNNFPK